MRRLRDSPLGKRAKGSVRSGSADGAESLRRAAEKRDNSSISDIFAPVGCFLVTREFLDGDAERKSGANILTRKESFFYLTDAF
jgi:hypothetical protein